MSTDKKIDIVIDGRYQATESFPIIDGQSWYRATDLNLRRDVLLRLPGQEPTSHDKQIDHFQNEAKILARLSSPHILWLIDFGQTLGQMWYFIIEDLRGQTLSQHLYQQTKLSAKKCLQIMAQLCVALQEMHEKNLIFDNLQPGSIFLCSDDLVKIVDLSRTVARSSSNPEKTTLKEESQQSGSSILDNYLAPERHNGVPPTISSDIYAWGILAYELLTGRHPFEQYQGSGPNAHLVNRGVPASIPGCPDEVAALIFRSLQEEPSARPSSTSSLLDICMKSWQCLYPNEQLFGPAYIASTAHKRYRDPHLEKTVVSIDEKPFAAARLNAPELGSMIGKYRLVKQLGEGGMGVVFLAEHVYIANKLACKILRADFAKKPEFRRRFINEAKAMASLRHPNITSVFDCDVLPDGSAYILMEFLTGTPLSNYVRRVGQLTERETINIARQIISALIEAHNHNIIHRDLKPDNIFISATDGDVAIQVKVLDFGIAKFDSYSGLHEDGNQTNPDVIMGTPAYMPPEQIRSSARVDHRADLYALGGVLYFMLTGQPPFGQVENVGEYFAQVLTGTVPEIKRQINPRFAKIIYRLLDKSPNLRFQTADQVQVAFEGLINSYSEVEIESKRIDAEPGHESGDNLVSGIVPAGPAKALGAVFSTNIAQGAPHGLPNSDSWGILKSHLPLSWDNHLSTILIFLSKNFRECESIGSHVLRLNGVRLSDVSDYEFFAVFMEGTMAATDNPELGTRTFRNYTTPLEAYLDRFQSDIKKVVIVIADTMELGKGVREKILDYRLKYSAFVVPLYVGEIEKAPRFGYMDSLFFDRLTDLHTAPDYFSNNPRTGDPTSIFGLRGLTNDITTLLRQKPALISIFGVPGSGKTTLVKMIEYSLDNSRFSWIRCDALTEENVGNLVAAITRTLFGDTSPEVSSPREEPITLESTLLTLRPVLEGLQRPKERLVLVLENADWLLGQLRPGSSAIAQTEQTRKFLVHLVGLTQANLVTVIITSIRGFSLASRALYGWANPLASVVHCFMAPPIEYHAMVRMVQELGIQMNVAFSPDAIRLAYEWSGGNISVIRKLCSYVVNWHRQRAERNVLAAVNISRRDIDQACQDLVSARATFGETILPWLSESERTVLYQIAAGRPRRIEHLKETLGGIATSSDVSDALDLLQQTGLVRRTHGRLRVSIPLLEAWVKANIDQSHVEIQRVSSRRFRWISGGMALTALSFLVYWQVFQLSLSYANLESYEKCSYAVKFPRRGIESAEVYMFRTCQDDSAPLMPVNVFVENGTVAKFGEYFGEARDAFKCPPAQPRCSQSFIEIKLISPWMDGYSFSVTVGNKTIGRFCIQHDQLSRIRKSFDSAWKIISLLPAFLGLLAAFFKDWMEALSKLRAALWGRKADSLASTDAGKT